MPAREAELQLEEVQAQRAAVSAILGGELFAAEVRAEIAALDDERAALGYDSQQHSAARQQLETFPDFEPASRSSARRGGAARALLRPCSGVRAVRSAAHRPRRGNGGADAIDVEIARLELVVREEQEPRIEVNRQLRTEAAPNAA